MESEALAKCMEIMNKAGFGKTEVDEKSPLVESDSGEESSAKHQSTKITADSDSESNSEDEYFRTGKYTERNRKARMAEMKIKRAMQAAAAAKIMEEAKAKAQKEADYEEANRNGMKIVTRASETQNASKYKKRNRKNATNARSRER